MKQRQEATKSLETLTDAQDDLRTAKATVQRSWPTRASCSRS